MAGFGYVSRETLLVSSNQSKEARIYVQEKDKLCPPVRFYSSSCHVKCDNGSDERFPVGFS